MRKIRVLGLCSKVEGWEGLARALTIWLHYKHLLKHIWHHCRRKYMCFVLALVHNYASPRQWTIYHKICRSCVEILDTSSQYVLKDEQDKAFSALWSGLPQCHCHLLPITCHVRPATPVWKRPNPNLVYNKHSQQLYSFTVFNRIRILQ